MIIIEDGSSIIKTVIGDQKIKSTEYRPMNYILEVEVDDKLLLQNVITGQLVLLENDEKIFFRQPPGMPIKETEQLISSYFLVPVEFDEKEFVQGYRKILQQIERNKKKNITKYTIFPTTCCNAHCFYCFESEFKKTNMSEETAKKVAEFISSNCGKSKAEINWFGGEPTVASNRIDTICESLKESGTEFFSGMVSNGYLFDKEMVLKAVKDWHLKSIQITLDGTEEIYNQTKQFNVLGSAYLRVLDNINLLLEANITVTVLLNLDYHNYDDLFVLVEELSNRFHKYSNFRVSSHVLFNNEGYDKIIHTDKEEEDLANRNYILGDHISKVGLNGSVMGDILRKGKLPQLRYQYCMVNDSSAIVIGPYGDFFKCEHIADSLTSSAGIDKGFFSNEELDKWFEPIEKNDCYKCCLYPNCFVPVDCKDHVKCYPSDSVRKIANYKEIVKNKYYNFVHSRKGGKNEKV